METLYLYDNAKSQRHIHHRERCEFNLTQRFFAFQDKGDPVSNNPHQNQPGATLPQELPQGMAIAALVTGILSLTLCGIFTAIPAIICGHVGVKQADNGEASGRTMAMAGMIMGYISLALTLLAIIAYVVLIVFVIGAAAAGGAAGAAPAGGI